MPLPREDPSGNPALSERKTDEAASVDDGARRAKAGSCMKLDAGLVCFLALVLAVFVAVHHYLEPRFDFGVFYYAAHMVLDGSRHVLYNFDAQHAFQIRFNRPPDTLFRNPPFALLPILVIAKLPLLVAFSIWTAVSFVLLYISLKTLEFETGVCYGNWPILLSLAYVPVMASFLHGQFSLLVLASVVLAYAQWKKGQLFLGGLILSIATLKFQLVIGLVAVLLLRGKWRELAGFASGCAVLLAISVSMTGIPALLAYPAFVLHSDTPISELPHMANLQGFLSLIGLNHVWILVPLSVLTVLWAARAWTDVDRGLLAAILAGMLVSFHLTPQDLSISLVPIYLSVKTSVLPLSRFPLFVFVVMIVLMVWVGTYMPVAILAAPIAAALWWVGRSTWARESKPQESTAA
jgi:Glycosyltransferase family 87